MLDPSDTVGAAARVMQAEGSDLKAKSVQTTAGSDGVWRAALPPIPGSVRRSLAHCVALCEGNAFLFNYVHFAKT